MRLLVLATYSNSTKILYNYLKRDFNITHVVIEDKIKTRNFLSYRFKKMSFVVFVDQLIFMVFASRVLSFVYKSKVKSLIGECNLDNSDIPNEVITKINSVNAKKVTDIINRENPDYILVNGTRIISRNVLNSTSIKFINIHAGITPAYRGVHGAYWALVNREKNLAGVTVHYVNSGVDTGEIISQTTIAIDESDCIITYPIKQLNEGLKSLSDFLKHKEIGCSFTPKLIEVNHSKQWFHPGFFQYLYHRIVYGIK